jgi:bacterioferritin-associated ferredoxin
MIVCVCNNISHSTVEQYTSLGVNSLNELQEHISISNKCRKCETCVVSMLSKNQFVPQCELSGNVNTKIDVQVIQFHYDKESNPLTLNDPYSINTHESSQLDVINDDSIEQNTINTSNAAHVITKKSKKMKM